MILYLVRHGETPHNRDGLGLGRTDVALTLLGERQAAATGGRLAREPLSRVYTSPLLRARTMALAIAGERGIPVEVREELTELDVGETEGMPFTEMRERYPGFLRQWAGPEAVSARMPGGESLADVAARVAPLVDEIIAGTDDAVAVVSHNFVTRMLVCRLLGIEVSAFRSFGVDLASVTTVAIRDGRAAVRALNDRCHLHGLEP